jgi:DNA/RNA-binding domain of Phe-tRNA-synthetase-like protein
MSIRVTVVADQMESALIAKRVTQSRAEAFIAVEAALNSMNHEELSDVMDKLESHFKELSNAISQAPTTTLPQ